MDNKEDILKRRERKSPKDDLYDYEVPEWTRDERIMIRYRSYKDWI